MIERMYGKFVLACDNCGQPAEEQFDTMKGAVDYRRENGWKVRIDEKTGEWVDNCAECVGVKRK